MCEQNHLMKCTAVPTITMLNIPSNTVLVSILQNISSSSKFLTNIPVFT